MAKSKRTRLVAGNWKMFKDRSEAAATIAALKEQLTGDVDVWLAVPFTAIAGVVEAAGDAITVGAQNMNDATEGAFTGEIAGKMLVDVGAKFVLLGHSERRHVFGEDDAFVNRKVHRALEDGLTPIVCVGETLEQREAGQTEEVLKAQFTASLEGVGQEQATKIVLAYEPVWAIGTGVTASPEDAQNGHALLRGFAADLWTQTVADGQRILYGGSVKPSNASELMGQADVDGVLVGGASLDADTFAQIVNCDKSAAKA